MRRGDGRSSTRGANKVSPVWFAVAVLLVVTGFAGPLFAGDTRPAEKARVQDLEGRWLRPDGGYVLELRQVRGDGSLEALYFNPRPIHVGRAELREEGGTISVFVELRDVNYPGSTYTLWYDPEEDRLRGAYFQAVLRETYEVEFVRIR